MAVMTVDRRRAYDGTCRRVGAVPTGVLNTSVAVRRLIVVPASESPHASLKPTLKACEPVMYDADPL